MKHTAEALINNLMTSHPQILDITLPDSWDTHTHITLRFSVPAPDQLHFDHLRFVTLPAHQLALSRTQRHAIEDHSHPHHPDTTHYSYTLTLYQL